MASVSAFQLLLGYRASPPTTCGGREFLASALDNVKHGERETMMFVITVLMKVRSNQKGRLMFLL
jgi:hypothetical protein